MHVDELRAGIYKTGHDNSTGCVNLASAARSFQVLDTTGGAHLDDGAAPDQYRAIGNDGQFAEVPAAPRTCRVLQCQQLARAPHQDFVFRDGLR